MLYPCYVLSHVILKILIISLVYFKALKYSPLLQLWLQYQGFCDCTTTATGDASTIFIHNIKDRKKTTTATAI